MSPQQHWYILGAGAIGSLWSAYWVLDNQPTTIITRRASQKQRLTLHHQDKTFSFTQNQVNYGELDEPIKYLLITTKAHQTLEALANIAPRLTDDAVVVLLQNGLAAKSIALLPNQTLIAATTTDGAHFKNSENLNHIGPGQTYFGCINASQVELTTDQQKSLRTLLPAELNIQPCNNIEERLWQKLAINCAINALGVKHQCTNGELVSNTIIREELELLCEEISRVTAALELGPWFQTLYQRVVEVAQLTSHNINSTLQDIKQGKETEITELNGYLCRCAEEKQVSVPFNQALVDLVLEQSKQQENHQ